MSTLESTSKAQRALLFDQNARLPITGQILLGTNNAQKLEALSTLLSDAGIDFKTQDRLDSPEETGSTVVENALLKAWVFAQSTNCPALSDDTGFMISAIGDEPGAAQIDWAGPDTDFNVALAQVRARLEERGVFEGPAYFETCIALALPDGSAIVETARTEGRLVWPPAGPTDGYLSIFARDGEASTVSQQKAKRGLAPGGGNFGFSHRDIAVRNLIARLDFVGRDTAPGIVLK